MKRSIALKVVKQFPANFNLDDLLERLVVIEKIESGLKEVKENRTLNHKNAKGEIKKWLK